VDFLVQIKIKTPLLGIHVLFVTIDSKAVNAQDVAQHRNVQIFNKIFLKCL